MGKRAEQAKKRRRLNAGPAKSFSCLPSPPTPNGQDEGGSNAEPTSLVSSEDLETTLYVLKMLSENPDEMADKRMKDLKRGIYDLHRVLMDGATLGNSLTSKVSAALQDYRFTDALIHLFEMYTRRMPPKLGALQRWVRECDATSNVDGSRDTEALLCLDMILRIATMDAGASGKKDEKRQGDEGEIIKRKAVWQAEEAERENEIKIWERMQAGTLFETSPPNPYPNFKAVHHTPGPQRRPPNLYSSTVYASAPGTILLEPASTRTVPTKIDVPAVPGCFMVKDVFTPHECLQIAQAAHAIGFEMDQAAGGSATMKSSILAKNFLWLADSHFLDHFYAQILPFVPQHAPLSMDGNGGGRVRGINARFRVYQYTENQVYRPHIDGAWPAAGLDPVTGEYLHDSSPPEDPLWSRYTLLVYLNSDIPTDTGCTTFFLPSENVGTMEATSVRPLQGAVLCFREASLLVYHTHGLTVTAHGDTHGSLLHEGSAVGAGGGKLVIRTDLLYEAKGFGEFKPPNSVGVMQGGKAEEGIGG
ncbi:hypothetical protein P7C73_g6203, partial [Tremellales sp. Uapishka_1]